MLAMLQDLIRHQGYANAALVKAIGQHPAAAQDPELRGLLHHIILANRFWLSLSLGRPFAVEAESSIPESLDAITARYRETHEQELAWLAGVQEPDLARTLETSFLPDHRLSVAQAWVQVCMHSQGHRAQGAARLRLLGGTPPSMDFVLWLKARPAADWE